MFALPLIAFAQAETPDVATRIERLMEEGFNQGNVNVIDDLFAENFIVHPSEGNRDAFKESALSLRAMFPDVHAEASQIVVQGNWATFHFTLFGTFANAYTTDQGSIPPTNQFTTLSMNVFLRYDEEGKVAEEWDYMDNYGFLAQIGVLESLTSSDTPVYATSKLTTNAKPYGSDVSDMLVANKANVQRVFDEILNMRNVSASNNLFATDFIYHGVQGDTNLAMWSASVSNMLAAMPDLLVTPEIMIAQGDLVAVRYTLRGTFSNPLGAADGSTVAPNNQYVELPGSMIIRFDSAGKIVETTEVFDNLSLLTQLGIFAW